MLHESTHCVLAYAGGAEGCRIDLAPGPCPRPGMTLTGYCLGSATMAGVEQGLPLVVEEVLAYGVGALAWSPLAIWWWTSRHGCPTCHAAASGG